MSKTARDGRILSMKKPRAVFTIQHNEKVFLPIWLKHYSQFFDPEDIYVISHKTNPEIMEPIKAEFKFQEEKREDGDKFFNHDFLRHTAIHKQKLLLEKYETVLFAEADEIIIAKDGFLDKLMDNFQKDFTYCEGYEVIHKPDEEGAIDLSKPLLQQRKYWGKNHYYDKPLLSKIPLYWVIGFHTLEPDPHSPEEKKKNMDLMLIHLKRMDWNIARARWDYTHLVSSTDTRFEEHFNIYNNLMIEIPKEYKNII